MDFQASAMRADRTRNIRYRRTASMRVAWAECGCSACCRRADALYCELSGHTSACVVLYTLLSVVFSFYAADLFVFRTAHTTSRENSGCAKDAVYGDIQL